MATRRNDDRPDRHCCRHIRGYRGCPALRHGRAAKNSIAERSALRIFPFPMRSCAGFAEPLRLSCYLMMSKWLFSAPGRVECDGGLLRSKPADPLLRQETAVYRQQSACDITCVVARKEQHPFRDLFRFPDSPHRRSVQDAFAHIRWLVTNHIGVDQAG